MTLAEDLVKTRSAGQLRWQVQLQQLPSSPASNDFNEPSYTGWTTYATVWANIKPLSGRELFWAREIVADVSHVVEIRYWPRVVPKHRVLYVDQFTAGTSRILNILAVTDDEEKHRWMDLLCRESV